MPKSRAGLTLTGDFSSAVESPDGKSLFVPVGSPGGPTGRAKLFRIELANPKPVELVSAADISSLQLSPDGASMAYTQWDTAGRAPAIYTMSFDGTKPQKVVAEGMLESWVTARAAAALAALAPALTAPSPPRQPRLRPRPPSRQRSRSPVSPPVWTGRTRRPPGARSRRRANQSGTGLRL